MKSLRNRILTLVGIGVLGIGISAAATPAQSTYQGSFKLDHSIRWQLSTLPAGDYTFTMPTESRRAPMTVTGPNGSVFQLPMVISDAKMGTPSALKLEWRGDTLCVRELNLGEVGLNIRYHLPKVADSENLLAQGPARTEEVLIAMVKR